MFFSLFENKEFQSFPVILLSGPCIVSVFRFFVRCLGSGILISFIRKFPAGFTVIWCHKNHVIVENVHGFAFSLKSTQMLELSRCIDFPYIKYAANC